MSTQFSESAHPRAGDGRFATKAVDEAGDVDLAPASVPAWDEDDWEPAYKPDGSLDVATMVAQGRIGGFGPDRWATPFAEPQTMTMVGHWDGNEIVVEGVYEGEVPDEREDTGYWPEGMWASSATGHSMEDIGAQMIAEYDECSTIRAANPDNDDDYTPDSSSEDWENFDDES